MWLVKRRRVVYKGCKENALMEVCYGKNIVKEALCG